MPFHFDLFEDARLVVTRCAGTVTRADVGSAYLKIFGRIAGWDEVAEITDLGGADAHHLPAPHVVRDLAERMAGNLARYGLRARNAIIAPTDLLYGLAGVYHRQAAFLGRQETHVVRTADEAADWAGIEPGRLIAVLADDDRRPRPARIAGRT